MSSAKRILFITTNNLTTNPRLLKELKMLKNEYECEVLGFRLGNWSDKIDAQLELELKDVKLHYLSASRTPFLNWVKASFSQLVCRIIYKFYKASAKINAYASDKRSYLLHQRLKNKGKFDLVMAHNLGALFPAWKYSKSHKIPFSFDIEDYHPGERIEKDNKNERARREFLLKKILPETVFSTFASPLIGKRTSSLVPGNKLANHFLINNSFFPHEFYLAKENKHENSKIRFSWFSQNINYGRGLEVFLLVLDEYQDRIELHLFGHLNSNFANNEIYLRNYVKSHGPLSQTELHKHLCKFDVGLAIEDAAQDENRNLCLTNKLWAYVQAGLYVVASDTSAQSQFIDKYPDFGEIVTSSLQDRVKSIAKLLENIGKIREGKEGRFEKSKSLGWEKEGQELLKIIQTIQ